MTRNDILRWARESRLYGVDVDGLERFAHLVAAHERAQCEAICVNQSLYYAEQDRQAESGAAGCCGLLIRARGKE